MTAPLVARDGSIRLLLTLPVTRVGFGPFTFDPVEQAIGAPLSDILAPLMTGPVQRRPSAAGPAVDVYPLRLPDGEGISIPLGQWGEVGFRNDGGLLVLTVPLAAAAWLRDKLGTALAHGPVQHRSLDGTALVADCWVQIRPGMRASFPLGMLGEVGVEAG